MNTCIVVVGLYAKTMMAVWRITLQEQRQLRSDMKNLEEKFCAHILQAYPARERRAPIQFHTKFAPLPLSYSRSWVSLLTRLLMTRSDLVCCAGSLTVVVVLLGLQQAAVAIYI